MAGDGARGFCSEFCCEKHRDQQHPAQPLLREPQMDEEIGGAIHATVGWDLGGPRMPGRAWVEADGKMAFKQHTHFLQYSLSGKGSCRVWGRLEPFLPPIPSLPMEQLLAVTEAKTTAMGLC